MNSPILKSFKKHQEKLKSVGKSNLEQLDLVS